jgi:BioD-like phosphotransacetylase family protein
MAPILLVGSCVPFGGKSAVVLGLGRQLLRRGVKLLFGKPLAADLEAGVAAAAGAPADALALDVLPLDADVNFVGATLGLPASQLLPSVDVLDRASAERRLLAGNLQPGGGFEALRQQLQADGDAVALLEAGGSLQEGLLYGLSLPQLAQGLQAPVLLVHPWRDSRSLDPLLAARDQLGDLLLGVVLNAVEPDAVPALREQVAPALERLGLPVLGVMPRSPLLRSVTVAELARRLDARVLCCRDRLDLLVETLSIGAMNVNAAMEFFRRRRNMAVVTGADRTDIQLAALEASTQCLILTGAGEPLPQLLNRAEELDVPLLKVDHDTLTTVELIEHAFGNVGIHESVKATYALRLVEESCDFSPLFARMGLPG